MGRCPHHPSSCMLSHPGAACWNAASQVALAWRHDYWRRSYIWPSALQGSSLLPSFLAERQFSAPNTQQQFSYLLPLLLAETARIVAKRLCQAMDKVNRNSLLWHARIGQECQCQRREMVFVIRKKRAKLYTHQCLPFSKWTGKAERDTLPLDFNACPGGIKTLTTASFAAAVLQQSKGWMSFCAVELYQRSQQHKACVQESCGGAWGSSQAPFGITSLELSPDQSARFSPSMSL